MYLSFSVLMYQVDAYYTRAVSMTFPVPVNYEKNSIHVIRNTEQSFPLISFISKLTDCIETFGEQVKHSRQSIPRSSSLPFNLRNQNPIMAGAVGDSLGASSSSVANLTNRMERLPTISQQRRHEGPANAALPPRPQPAVRLPQIAPSNQARIRRARSGSRRRDIRRDGFDAF